MYGKEKTLREKREHYQGVLHSWSYHLVLIQVLLLQKKSQWRMEHISKRKNKNTFTQREGEKWKGCQGRPTLCHVLSCSAWHFISVSPPSLPLRLRKVCGKQHLQFSFQMPMHVPLLSTQSHRDVEWIKNNTPTHTHFFFFMCNIYTYLCKKLSYCKSCRPSTDWWIFR